MQNIQSFHTSNYRGNQPGHDSNLRSDSKNPSTSSSKTAFEPTGTVQSFYNQPQKNAASFSSSAQSFHTANYKGDQPGHDAYLRSDAASPTQSGFSGIGAGASYASQSAQSGASAGASYSSASAKSGASNVNAGASYGSSIQSFHTANYKGDQPGHDSYLREEATTVTSAVNTNSFHTANYKGDQPGHDSYLREDSPSPSSLQ